MELVAKKNNTTIKSDKWQNVTLGEVILKIIGGGTPSRANSNYWGRDIPWVTVKDLNNFNPKTAQEYITFEGLKNSASHLIPRGTIITSTRMALGRTVVYDVDVAINQDLKAIFPNKRLETQYLNCWFDFHSKEIEELGSGSTVMGISLGDLKALQIALPPLHEQQAIAQVLSDTDKLIQALEKKIAKKKLIKQGVMQQLLTPKEGWETLPLTEVVDYIHGKAHEQDIVDYGEYTVVNSKFISTDGRVCKYSRMNNCPARKDDILTVLSDIPNGKALAKCFYVEKDDTYTVNQRICIWRTKQGHPRFLYYILNRHKHFLALNDGVNQTNIGNQDIEKCMIQIPSTIDEQIHIAQVIDDINHELQALTSRLVKYNLAKQGMTQQLLTGKIRLV